MRSAALIGLGLLFFSGCRDPEPVTAAAVASRRAGAAQGIGQSGLATYYSNALAGHKTASGERYDPDELTAAHRTLPFGTKVAVVRADGRMVRVRINDRGPFVKGRIIDLSHAAAEQIGLVHDGIANVTVWVMAGDE